MKIVNLNHHRLSIALTLWQNTVLTDENLSFKLGQFRFMKYFQLISIKKEVFGFSNPVKERIFDDQPKSAHS